MLTLGITSFLSQISLVAAMAAINNMIRKYGALDAVFGQEQYAQIPMAVVGIVMKFFQIVISIVVGMAAGCIPIVGFNMGARKSARVKELFTRLLAAEAGVGAVALVLVEIFPRQLIALFGAANESVYYTDFAVRSFRIYLCMIILACVKIRPASSSCRQWEKRGNLQPFRWCARRCLALGLRCCCRISLGWMAFCTRCRCRIF